MQPSERSAFFAHLSVIAETMNRKLSPVLLKTYWGCLTPYPFAEVQQALTELLKNPHIKKHAYFPLPTEIIEVIEGDVQSKSLLAWSEVIKAIRQIGQYDSVIFSDELIHAVIRDMGGWIRLCQLTEKELPFSQRDFERRYQVYCRKRPQSLPIQLTGRLAHENAVNGYESYVPKAITLSTKVTEASLCDA